MGKKIFTIIRSRFGLSKPMNVSMFVCVLVSLPHGIMDWYMTCHLGNNYLIFSLGEVYPQIYGQKLILQRHASRAVKRDF